MRLLRVGVTLALLGFVLRRVDWTALGQILLGARPRWLLLACLGALARVVLLGLRWRLILLARGIHFSLLRICRLFLISALWDAVVPANLGGDAYRIRQAAAQGGLLRSGTTVLWDRTLGSVTQLLLGGLALLLTRNEPPIRTVFGEWAAIFALAFLAGGATFLVAAERFGRGIRTESHGGSRLGRLRELVHVPRRVLAGGMFYSLLGHLTTILVFYCVLAAVGLERAVPPVYFVLAVTVATLALSIPVSVAGIGVTENLFAILFGPFGVSTSASVAFSWLALLAGRGSTAAIGGLLFAFGREDRLTGAETHAADRG